MLSRPLFGPVCVQYWFNGAKRHLLGAPDDKPRATTPYIELFFVYSSDSSKDLAAIPFTQFKDMATISEGSLCTWWPLIVTPTQKRRKVLPTTTSDGKHLLQWPFQGQEKELEESGVLDVRRSFLSKTDLEKRYKAFAGLSDATKLTTDDAEGSCSGDRRTDVEQAERLRDFELVGARLYTGEYTRHPGAISPAVSPCHSPNCLLFAHQSYSSLVPQARCSSSTTQLSGTMPPHTSPRACRPVWSRLHASRPR